MFVKYGAFVKLMTYSGVNAVLSSSTRKGSQFKKKEREKSIPLHTVIISEVL